MPSRTLDLSLQRFEHPFKFCTSLQQGAHRRLLHHSCSGNLVRIEFFRSLPFVTDSDRMARIGDLLLSKGAHRYRLKHTAPGVWRGDHELPIIVELLGVEVDVALSSFA